MKGDELDRLQREVRYLKAVEEALLEVNEEGGIDEETFRDCLDRITKEYDELLRRLS